eukprot:CAMPEP_0175838784 /NCGR_PEP_ID=MMETSP0107_2-20121207/18453_1 /TAXON_ID=195067 ORGANISM="Goniomonas pacifica, Strain CCMP1869" /NCGR_SAMPLE_ID=MMETSP0107_2 /ASSEMBLY_ACC=CAM_ASM_000203 /LENGTH=74 /DNA_ID=CAMNT_0017152453 /DNA_START=54 /DNA_END=278 /DNA_ORIENTATION=-
MSQPVELSPLVPSPHDPTTESFLPESPQVSSSHGISLQCPPTPRLHTASLDIEIDEIMLPESMMLSNLHTVCGG